MDVDIYKQQNEDVFIWKQKTKQRGFRSLDLDQKNLCHEIWPNQQSKQFSQSPSSFLSSHLQVSEVCFTFHTQGLKVFCELLQAQLHEQGLQ